MAWRSTCGRSVPMKVAVLTQSSIESALAIGSASAPTASIQASAPRPFCELHGAVVDTLLHEIGRLGSGLKQPGGTGGAGRRGTPSPTASRTPESGRRTTNSGLGRLRGRDLQPQAVPLLPREQHIARKPESPMSVMCRNIVRSPIQPYASFLRRELDCRLLIPEIPCFFPNNRDIKTFLQQFVAGRNQGGNPSTRRTSLIHVS
jgi:hypothetical protein